MTPRTLIHTALLMAVIAALGVVAMDRAWAAEPHISGVSLVGTDATTLPVTLRVGKSLVYDFPRDIKDVLVADPKTANVVIRSSRRAYIIGDLVGETSIVFFDAGGTQMARFEITVTKVPLQRDVSIIEKAILNLFCPRRDVQCEDFVKVGSIGDGIILTGTVASQLEAQQAFDIASHFLDPCAALGTTDSIGNGGPGSSSSSVSGCAASGPTNGGGGAGAALNSVGASKIVNAIMVRGRDQVMLKVTVAEMDRTVLKQLGVNLNGSLSLGTSVFNFNNNNPFPVNGQLSAANPFGPNGLPSLVPNSPAGITGTFNNRVTANLQAMEQAGIVRTLAEPTLTAISGESAHFLAGGMFPYPTVSGCTPNSLSA